MRKILFTVALLCIASASAHAQGVEWGSRLLSGVIHATQKKDKKDKDASCFEGEIGVGVVFGAHKNPLFQRNQPGFTLYAEGRYNFPKEPIDIGLQASWDSFFRESNWGDEQESLFFESWHLMAVSDYYLRHDKKVSFFAGLGLGYARLRVIDPRLYSFPNPAYNYYEAGGSSQGGICIMPRIGIEFFHHLRLTLDYKIQERDNRHFNIGIGGVFGGGKKKNNEFLY